MPRRRLPVQEIADGQEPKAPSEKPRVIVLAAELRVELGLLGGDMVGPRETFSVALPNLTPELLQSAIDTLNAKKAELQAQV